MMGRVAAITNGPRAVVAAIDGPGGPVTVLSYVDVASETCLIHLHGKGGDVLSGPPRWLPALLPDLAHVAVNLGCRGLAWTRYDRRVCDPVAEGVEVDGGYWEDLERGIEEGRAVIAAVRDLGYRRIVLVGHSSGGFYAGRLAAELTAEDGLVLLSPVTDNRSALTRWFPDERTRAATVKRAQEMVAAGGGRELIEIPRWYWRLSAQALLERAAEEPQRWQQVVAAARAPTLVLVGGDEAAVARWERMAAGLPGARVDFVEVDGADHFYVGAESAVARVIAGFVEGST